MIKLLLLLNIINLLNCNNIINFLNCMIENKNIISFVENIFNKLMNGNMFSIMLYIMSSLTMIKEVIKECLDLGICDNEL